MRKAEEISNIDSFEPAQLSPDENEKIAGPALTSLQHSWRQLCRNKGAILSLIAISVLVFLAIVGPYMNDYTYFETDYSASYQGSSPEHWLGTDKFGRDQWTRIWQGTRVSLYIAVLAAVLDLIIGVVYGAISAYAGGKVDNVMQRIIEILVGIPNLIIVIMLIMLMKPGIFTITVAMVITGWVNMARLVRAQIFKLKEQEYVLAARTLGTSNFRLIAKHMIPNTIGLIIINIMFTIPSAIFTEAFLSFIGLGLQEPQASLGVLINDGYQSIRNQYHLLLYPAIVIITLMVSFNLLADGLRDALDPKMRR
ncbi:ABC transporter permease [Alkalihalobacillus sp. AL-G]|uniref:ABC transporter permease n=1 Tax=Alkalihalobacillus sp. AL-G TaxID=2926399 RepID=UPI00272ADFAB|nr:ABC transporter permease [Alkalihalobacillus sp. AL-G]WLD94534.1 ABC transporter permease [Alkalihalobacillus sp. AL-G]